MENEHIVKSFDDDLSRIERLLLEMGGLVEAQIVDATAALTHRDVDLGAKVEVSDARVDALEYELNDMTVNMLALRQPMATDLRYVVSALKIAANLERIGDYAKNIAKRTCVLAQTKRVGSSVNTIRRMSAMVQEMVRQVLDAFVERDVQAANDVRARDEEVDQMHNALFRELLTYMMEDPRNITPSMHLLFIAKNVERMGDHATGIAEQVHYFIAGKMPEDERPKSDTTSTMIVDVDERTPKRNGSS